MSKDTLRKAMLQRRKAAPFATITQDSDTIHAILCAHEVWKKSQSVALYMAQNDEVHTKSLVHKAWEEGKHVYLPRCREKAYGFMDFYACNSEADIAPGAFGIYEPTAEAAARKGALLEASAGLWPLDLLLVPGVVFDKAGYRIGFGGGYYDRFLSMLKGQKTHCIGMAFSWQVLENIPHETWDMPMHGIVHEEGLLWI